MERRQNNGNPDEVELGGRTEEGKKWRTLQKLKNYGAHKKRSQTLHNKYLKQWLQAEGGAKYTEEKYVITACREVKEEKKTKKEEQKGSLSYSITHTYSGM